MATGFAGMGCGCCTTGVACGSSCTVPANDLTVHWTNAILGNGSVTLTYDGSVSWNFTGCSNELQYKLACVGGGLVFTVTYFISSACPSGTRQTCENGGGTGHNLTVTSLTCGTSFDMVLSCGSGCPVLQSNGFTGFEVTNP